ncbi:MAG: hypothetical protein AAF125_01640 [Chloroflexota bacterium]
MISLLPLIGFAPFSILALMVGAGSTDPSFDTAPLLLIPFVILAIWASRGPRDEGRYQTAGWILFGPFAVFALMMIGWITTW